MTEYYDKKFAPTFDSPIRTAKVVDGNVVESFVWQPGGNVRGFDGPDPDNCQYVEDLRECGYKRRR